ncbi:MAG: hypothetical protein AAGC53_14870 [Actinomycetota bacterium]
MSETRVDDPPQAEADGVRLICSSCDVGWWGDEATECWFCGAPGEHASATRRVVRDESAA